MAFSYSLSRAKWPLDACLYLSMIGSHNILLEAIQANSFGIGSYGANLKTAPEHNLKKKTKMY